MSLETLGIYRNVELLPSPCVLFTDYNNHWCPLSHLYWSTSSNLLVSRHPESIIEEVLSSYCPNCFTKLMEDEVNTYCNTCPSCFLCPLCESTLQYIPIKPDQTILQCSYCNWKSDDAYGLLGKDKMQIIAKVKINREKFSTKKQFQSLLKHYKDLYDNSTVTKKATDTSKELVEKAWRLEDVEIMLDKKNINRVPNLDEQPPVSTLTKVDQEGDNEHVVPYNLRGVRLMNKRTIRCRHDVENGLLSILVQPKLFPLDGDSSLKVSKGKWWVKDTSAVHEIPRIIITKLPTLDNLCHNSKDYLYLQIENPKDSQVSIELEFNCENEFEKSEKFPFSLSKVVSLMPSSNSSNLRVEFGAYEDIVLKDAALNDPFCRSNIDPSPDFASFFSNYSAIDKLGCTEWPYQVVDHKCKLAIPVKFVPSSSTESILSSPRTELSSLILQLKLKYKITGNSQHVDTDIIIGFHCI